jgi:3D (Asp-Asp-Asp) domain-containing protein
VKVAAILTAMVFVCANPFDSILNAYVQPEQPPRTELQKITTEVIAKEVAIKTSAYYAPTRNQDGEYATGSFEGDVRLNGSGRITKFAKKSPHEKTVATDPVVFPPGTKLRLYDPKLPLKKRVYYNVIAEDGGEAIVGNRLDKYMGKGKYALRKALKWGKKRMVAQVIEKREVIILAQR